MEAVDSATKRARVFVCAGVGERACVYVRANLNHVTAPLHMNTRPRVTYNTGRGDVLKQKEALDGPLQRVHRGPKQT